MRPTTVPWLISHHVAAKRHLSAIADAMRARDAPPALDHDLNDDLRRLYEFIARIAGSMQRVTQHRLLNSRLDQNCPFFSR
jgi:hypothetical protein